MAYRMTPARRAALKKAQAASARKRRGGRLARAGRAAKGVASAQRKYSRRKKAAKLKRRTAERKNESMLFKPASKKNPKKTSARWAKNRKKNLDTYKKSKASAKRIRRNQVRRAVRGR